MGVCYCKKGHVHVAPEGSGARGQLQEPARDEEEAPAHELARELLHES